MFVNDVGHGRSTITLDSYYVSFDVFLKIIKNHQCHKISVRFGCLYRYTVFRTNKHDWKRKKCDKYNYLAV